MSECLTEPTGEGQRPTPPVTGRSPLHATTRPPRAGARRRIDAEHARREAARRLARARLRSVPPLDDDTDTSRPAASAQAGDRPPPVSAGTIAKYGVLGRFVTDNDPHHGTALYTAVVTQDTTQLTSHGWLDRLEAITHLEARITALKAQAIAGFDTTLHGTSADLGHRHPQPGDRPATPGERRWHAGDLRSVSDEIALVLNLHRGAATARIHTSCELVHNFPATLHALTEGDLTERAAFTIVRELSILDDLHDLRAAEAAILAWARKHPLQQIKQACQAEAARRCPAATDKAHRRALDERAVRLYPNDIGTAELVHTHDAIDAAAIMTSLTRAATRHRRNGDPRTLDQLRADIAQARLLPRTKHTTTTPTDLAAPTPEPPTNPDPPDPDPSGPGPAKTGPADTDPFDPEPFETWPPEPFDADPPDEDPLPEQPPATTLPGYAPNDNNHQPADHQPPDHRPADHQSVDHPSASDDPGDDDQAPAGDPPTDPGLPRDHTSNLAEGNDTADTTSNPSDDYADLLDEATNGADTTVIIHATGAELRALLNGEPGTGGTAEHHGPIPQTSLRKHLIKALAQTLLPPSAPGPQTIAGTQTAPGTQTFPGAQTAPGTQTFPGTQTSPGSPARPQYSSAPRTDSPPGSPTTQDTTTPGARTHHRGRSYLDVHLTDQPPPSNPNRYTPSAALDTYIRLRDRTCLFPGCNQPARYADLDHRTPYTSGGTTSADNLQSLCRHHHRLKHEGGWTIHPNPDHTHTWTSPTGRPYRDNTPDPEPAIDPAT